MKLSGNYLWISLPALMLAAGTAFAGPPQAVSDCDTLINAPGKYKVVNDLYCDPGEGGITILASNVMLDFAGHNLTCAVGDRAGVVVGDDLDPEIFRNVHISNGSVSGCGVGVLLWFTHGTRVTKMSFNGNLESAVTLVETENNVIKHNEFEGDFWAINSYAGTGNRYDHNTIRYSAIGIDLYAETDSRITCNRVDQGYYTLSLGPYGQMPSSGNLVRGNRVTDSFLGIAMVGYGTPEDGITAPQSIDNLIHANIASGNWWDLAEALYNPSTDEIFLEPGAECQNTWKNNQFDWALGPPDCIGTPVNLNQVCGGKWSD